MDNLVRLPPAQEHCGDTQPCFTNDDLADEYNRALVDVSKLNTTIQPDLKVLQALQTENDYQGCAYIKVQRGQLEHLLALFGMKSNG